MQEITTEQALELLKRVLDVASKAGMFENLESAVAVHQAFAFVVQELNTKKQDG